MDAGNRIDQVQIRHVTKKDLLALEWEGEYIHFRRVYADAFERAQNGGSVLWVADLPGFGVIGQVFVQLICDRPELADGHTKAYVYAVRVRPQFRNLGVGTRLMDAAEADLRRRGFQWATLNVARDNPGAQRLYERRGYRVVAPEPGQWSYPDENGIWQSAVEPAWRMEKALG